MSRMVEIDTKTLVRFWLVLLGIVLAGWLLYQARAGLVIIGIAAFIAVAIQPLARKIGHFTKKDSNSLTSVLAYGLIVGVIGVILAVVGPVVIGETMQFVAQLPDTFEHTLGGWDGINNFGQSIGIVDLQGELMEALETFSTNFVNNLGGMLVTGVNAIAQLATAVVLTLVLTLLFAIEGAGIVNAFWEALETHHKHPKVKQYQHLMQRMTDVIATYVSRQVMVAFLDGVVTMIAVLLLAMVCGFSSSLALPMGLMALVLYLVPMFGPIMTCALVSLILLFSSPVAAVIFLVFYVIYSQVENNIIAPKIQGDALNLPVAVILVAIVIGIYTLGLVGAIIAIPVAGCIKVLFEEWPSLREEK